jgi:Mg-chelatase subunit ChlD
MTDPGTQTTPPSTISQYTTRVASGGVWPFSRVNPDLPARCGLKVAFVVDLSASVQGHVAALKSAADSFVDALRGTPSQAALFTFSTDSPALNAGPNTGLLPVATTADANRFKQLYSGWTESTASGYTNWDRALGAVAAVNESDNPDEHFDLTIVLTDGNPTAFGPQGPGYPAPAG